MSIIIIIIIHQKYSEITVDAYYKKFEKTRSKQAVFFIYSTKMLTGLDI